MKKAKIGFCKVLGLTKDEEGRRGEEFSQACSEYNRGYAAAVEEEVNGSSSFNGDGSVKSDLERDRKVDELKETFGKNGKEELEVLDGNVDFTHKEVSVLQNALICAIIFCEEDLKVFEGVDGAPNCIRHLKEDLESFKEIRKKLDFVREIKGVTWSWAK